MKIEIKHVPKGEKRAGMWTILADDKPTLWYASNKEGAQRKVARLMKGSGGGIIIPPIIANAAAMSKDQIKQAMVRHLWENTFEGFLKRGKLAHAE